MKIAGCQPDSGNPTVRDERGAYGNVSYGGIRNPLHKLKRCMSETLCLRLRAPYFYPTSGACLQRGDSGTWESQWFPWVKSGIGGPTIAVKTPGVVRRRPPRTRALQDQGTQSQRRDTRYRGRRGNTERPRDGPLAVLAAHSTEGQEPQALAEKVGNRCPRDPLEGRRRRA